MTQKTVEEHWSTAQISKERTHNFGDKNISLEEYVRVIKTFKDNKSKARRFFPWIFLKNFAQNRECCQNV